MTTVNFFLAQQIEKYNHTRPYLLWMGISLNLAVLFFFRTANFFLPEFYSLLAKMGIYLSFDSINILLPIGLAFYSIQNISYLVDVQREQTPAAVEFVDFALYLAYFPKLLSGPIERARTFLPKLARPRRVDNNVMARSVTLIIVGLFRKLVIAHILSAILIWDAFEIPSKYTGPELIAWIVIYGLFLYNDFAGYTSIARGVSGFFGIELSLNFNQPYFARNLTEFWNSWHITLSHWLRDYIYFPLGRAILRRNPSRNNLTYLMLPPMVTMLVSGLWHGVSGHMLLWGGLHGLYLIIERLSSLTGPIVPPQKWPFWRQILAMGVVFIFVTLAWVPFVTELPVAFSYWRGIFDWTYPQIRFRRILLFLPLLGLSLAIDWLQRYYQDEVFYLRWPRLVQTSLLAVSVFLLMFLMQPDQEQPFVYQGF